MVQQHANELLATFVVLEPGKVRFSQTPRRIARRATPAEKNPV
jgi:hypothetical protein